MLVLLFLLLSALCQAAPASWLRFGGVTEDLCVRGIARTSDGHVWLAAESGLYSFDGTHLTDHTPLHGHGSYNTIAAAGDSLVIGTNRGLISYRPSARHSTLLPFARDERITALALAAGSLWTATDRRLYLDGRPAATPAGSVLALAAAGHIIYIGRPAGAFRHDPATGRTVKVPGTPANACALLPDGRRLWIGTPTALYLAQDGRCRRVCNVPVAKCIAKAKGGRLLVGTDDGIIVIDTAKTDQPAQHLRHDTRLTTSLPGDAVWCLATDPDGNVWTGTDSGIALLPGRQRLTVTTLPQLTCTSLGNRITRTFIDSRGRQWLGGTAGLICIDHGDWDWHRMGDARHPLRHNRLRWIAEEKDRHIIIGGDMGLAVLDEAAGRFITYTIPDDPENWVYHLRQRPDGRWLITTFTATYLARLDHKNRKVIVKAVLPRASLEPKQPQQDSLLAAVGGRWLSASIAPDGRTALLGGKDRYATLRLDIPDPTGRLKLWTADGETQVEAAKEYIELRFSDFDFTRNDSPDYEYRLDDGGWIPVAGRDRTIMLPTPDAGRHKIEVRERAGHDKPAYLELTVLTPWWRGPWAATLIIIIVAAAVWAAIRIARDRRQAAQLAEQVRRLDARMRLTLQDGEMSDDERLLRRITQTIEEHLTDPTLDTPTLAKLCLVSEKQLYRKVKALTGLPTMTYIRQLRLTKAAALLALPGCTVQEAMYKCGFQNASHFARIFQKQYGLPPSEYAKQPQNRPRYPTHEPEPQSSISTA